MKTFAIQLGVLILPIIIWQVVFSLGLVSELLLPSPMSVVTSLAELLQDKVVLSDIAATLYLVFSSLFFGIVLGSVFGLLVGVSGVFKDTIMLWVDFVRSIPAPTLIPIFLLLFGLGSVMKIALATLVVGLIVLVSVVVGVRNTHTTRLMVGHVMELNKVSMLQKIIIPDMLPHVSAGIRLAISFALILVIVAEMLVSTQAGIGKRIVEFQLLFETGNMYALVLLTGAIGYLLNKLYQQFESRYIHWGGK